MVTVHSSSSTKEQVAWVVQQIHASNKQKGTPGLVFAVTTGGAAGFAGMLQSQPGASNTLYEARVPYHKAALTEFLGKEPKKFCAKETAIAMAIAARKKASYELSALSCRSIGLGLTAALATDRTRKGVDQVFIAMTQEPGIVWTVSAIFERGKTWMMLSK